MAITIFSTWTTYGTWLRGDQRGWFDSRHGQQRPNLEFEQQSKDMLTEPAVVLTNAQRELVHQTILEHCQIRKWLLHAASVRTNHVHVLLTTTTSITAPREQFIAWTTRRLREQFPNCYKWWTERGWDILVKDQAALDYIGEYIAHQ